MGVIGGGRAEGLSICLFYTLFSVVMHILLLRYFPRLSVHTCHVCQWILLMLWGREEERGGQHTLHIHTLHNTPSSQWAYCLDYNQSKCTYGCTCPPPPSSSPLSMPSRLFFSQISPPPCFCQTVGNKNAVSSSLFLTFQRHGKFPTKEEKKTPFKIHSRMSQLSLTDLPLSNGHKLFLQACQSRVNGST